MHLKRGDVVQLPDKSFGAIDRIDEKGVYLTCLVGFQADPTKGSYFAAGALHKIVHPKVNQCARCGSTPFVGKNPQRPEKKWRVFCVCDGPGDWHDTKAHAVLRWNHAHSHA